MRRFASSSSSSLLGCLSSSAIQPSRRTLPSAAASNVRAIITTARPCSSSASASGSSSSSQRIFVPLSATPSKAAPHHHHHQLQRSFHTSRPTQHGGIERPEPGKGIKVTFRDSKGQDIKTIECNEGDDLLSVAHEFDIDLEGACEGSIACSTCHVILEPDVYDQLEEPGDDENDMLDLAFGLTDTSRLGCQVKVTKAIDGMIAQLPSATRNMRVDGSKPTHH